MLGVLPLVHILTIRVITESPKQRHCVHGSFPKVSSLKLINPLFDGHSTWL